MIPGLSIPITIDLQNPYTTRIQLTQNEMAGRRLKFTIVSDGLAVDLTGKTVLLSGKKPDGFVVLLTLIADAPTLGGAYCDVTSQLVATSGDVDLQIRIFSAAATGTATSGTAASLYDTAKSWTANAHAGRWLYISAGTGAGQSRLILSNTATQIIVAEAWDVNPAAGSAYSIVSEVGNSFLFQALVWPSNNIDSAVISSNDFSALQAAIATAAGLSSRVTDVETAIALKAPLASPTFTGSVIVPTPTTAMQAATKKYVDDNMSGVSGWALISEAWTYLSANSVTVPAGAPSRFQKGDYIMLGQTTTKYFIVTSVSNTTVSLTGGSDYVVDNAPITAAYLSRAVNPFGFPSGFNYATVPTGFSSVPTGVTARFSVKGGICSMSVAQAVNGTSNSTAFTVPLPIQAANIAGAQWTAPAMIADNGAVPTTPGLAVVNAASASMSLYRDYAGSNFTASGGKRLAAVFLQYAI